MIQFNCHSAAQKLGSGSQTCVQQSSTEQLPNYNVWGKLQAFFGQKFLPKLCSEQEILAKSFLSAVKNLTAPLKICSSRQPCKTEFLNHLILEWFFALLHVTCCIIFDNSSRSTPRPGWSCCVVCRFKLTIIWQIGRLEIYGFLHKHMSFNAKVSSNIRVSTKTTNLKLNNSIFSSILFAVKVQDRKKSLAVSVAVSCLSFIVLNIECKVDTFLSQTCAICN